MKLPKVISYSLWGDDPKYRVGMQRNLELAPLHYPGWQSWIYYAGQAPEIPRGVSKTSVRLIDAEKLWADVPPSLWRFCVDPAAAELFISRDADSRLSERESLAVAAWLQSGKALHIMRDHPHHRRPIMAGMCGFRLSKTGSLYPLLREWQQHTRPRLDKWTDERFLHQVVFPKWVNDSLAHDSVCRHFPNSVSFPSQRVNYRFVGEIIDEHEQPYPQWEAWVNRREL
ncbi:MAG: hypothetical protein ACFB10_25340 [Salibacteraceae bacterium]